MQYTNFSQSLNVTNFSSEFPPQFLQKVFVVTNSDGQINQPFNRWSAVFDWEDPISSSENGAVHL